MRRLLGGTLCAWVLAAAAVGAQAQTPVADLELRIAKVSGFNMGARIEGKFRLSASGPADLQRVTFLIDGATMQLSTAPPFRFSFDTSAYASGRHKLSAKGETASGILLEADPLQVEFVTPEAARRSMLEIVIPILAIAAMAGVIALIGPLLIGGESRRQRHGEYGLAGGAICKRCGRPFSRHFITIRMLGRRLERCPHCGQWMMAMRASPADLAEAEARLADRTAAAAGASDEGDALRRMIEDSRFED